MGPFCMPDAQQIPDSLWQLKPWWCQPWSIVLTGVAIPTATWVFLHRLWIVMPISGVILVWWFLFLYAVPKQYAEAVKAQNSLNR